MSFRNSLDDAYGPCADKHQTMNCLSGAGTLKEIIAFSMS